MNEIHLATVDLNLLKVFHALAETGSASRAADRLGLTQSAVSHALNRLRHVFRDHLFVRERGGLTPTAFAREIAPRVRALLIEATQIVQATSGFDPETARRIFEIAMPDYCLITVLPRLQSVVAAAGNGLALSVHQTDSQNAARDLDRGRYSIVIGYVPTPVRDVDVEALFADRLVVAARDGHPLWRQGMSRDSYAVADHVDVARDRDGASFTEQALRGLGLTRTVKLTINSFLALPQVVAETGLVATEPERILAPFRSRFGYDTAPLPVASPRFTISLAMHRRIQADPGYRWLGALIERTFREAAI